MPDENKNMVEGFINKLKSHRLIWPIIIFGAIIIALSKFTNALHDIKEFIFPTQENTSRILDNSDTRKDEFVVDGSIQVIEKLNPYPVGFQKVKIGTKLTMINNYYDESVGSLSDSGNMFSLKINNDVYKHVTFYLEKDENPEVIQITFWPKNKAYMEVIKRQAIVAFDTINFKSFSLGKVLEWKGIEGVKISIDDDTYTISRLYDYEREALKLNKLNKNSD